MTRLLAATIAVAAMMATPAPASAQEMVASARPGKVIYPDIWGWVLPMLEGHVFGDTHNLWMTPEAYQRAIRFSACAADVDPETAQPLRLEEYWPGRRDPRSHQPGKEFELSSPALLVERRLIQLFPPGTEVKAATLKLEAWGLDCQFPDHDNGVSTSCYYFYYDPSAPQERGVIWTVWVGHEHGTNRIGGIHVSVEVAPLSMFPGPASDSDLAL